MSGAADSGVVKLYKWTRKNSSIKTEMTTSETNPDPQAGQLSPTIAETDIKFWIAIPGAQAYMKRTRAIFHRLAKHRSAKAASDF